MNQNQLTQNHKCVTYVIHECYTHDWIFGDSRSPVIFGFATVVIATNPEVPQVKLLHSQ